MNSCIFNLRRSRRPRSIRPRRRAGGTESRPDCRIEPLEDRWLRSVWPLAVRPNETIDQAQDLGTLSQRWPGVGLDRQRA